MKTPRVSDLRFSLGLVAVLLLAAIALAQPPAPSPTPLIRKVDPPNWWVSYTPELTLLLTGENLTAAKVASEAPGVRVIDTNASSNGHYLFVHLKLSAARAATARFKVSTAAGSASVQLPLLARADPRGHYQGFSPDDVIYLIMPDRFADGDASNDSPNGPSGIGASDRNKPMAYHGGDLRGVREHLAYLHDLGVTTVWLTPVWKNTDSDYHGYHVVDFYALDDHMGSMPEYQAMVAEAHKLGMKVLLDYVVNHTGPRHPWADDPPTPTWLHGTPAHHLEPSYDFSGIVDPHASPRQSVNTLEGWFAGRLPDLNPDDPALALYLSQNAMWWIEIAQLDGFRLDTFPYSSRRFWSGWHERVHQVYPQITDVGEVFDHDPSVTSFFEGGRKRFDGIDSGVTTVFDFPLEFAIRDVTTKGAPVGKLIGVLERDQLYEHPEELVTFIGNHDNRRFMNEEGATPEKLKAAFSLLLTMRGVPQIYAGDEIAMPGGDDPDNRRDFPGGFAGDPRNAFQPSGRTPAEQDVFSYVRSLLALRQAHPALRKGKQIHIGWGDNYYAFVRVSPEEKLLVVYNNSASPQQISLPTAGTPLEDARELAPLTAGGKAGLEGKQMVATISPWGVGVFTVR